MLNNYLYTNSMKMLSTVLSIISVIFTLVPSHYLNKNRFQRKYLIGFICIVFIDFFKLTQNIIDIFISSRTFHEVSQ